MGQNGNKQKPKKKNYTQTKIKTNNIAIWIDVPLRDLGIEGRDRENWKRERKKKNTNFVERERKI